LIQDFRHKGLARLYEKAGRKGLPAELVPKVERILARLDIATSPEMMNLPGLRLHSLKGKSSGFWSVWVSGNWRITFRFNGSAVADVDLVDYH
jgi:proteic killer suppression protein